MNIKMNNYLNQASYMAAAGERAPESHADGKIESEAKSGSNRDTVSISVEGQQFAAKQKASDSEMGLIEIASDLDELRSSVKSMNEELPVNWKAMVDPYYTITSLAKAESRLKQLADPTVSHNDEEMEKVAEAYAKEKIDALIEEYKTAYDAYHSENGSSLIAKMTGDTRKAYDIYKNIIDGAKMPIDDEEFLIFHNWTMYRAAKDEYIRKTDELYNAMNGVPLK